MTKDEIAKLPTPETDRAEQEYRSWLEYAKVYAHIPEAIEQAPAEADPFYISRALEQRLAAAVMALNRIGNVENLHEDSLRAIAREILQAIKERT